MLLVTEQCKNCSKADLDGYDCRVQLGGLGGGGGQSTDDTLGRSVRERRKPAAVQKGGLLLWRAIGSIRGCGRFLSLSACSLMGTFFFFRNKCGGFHIPDYLPLVFLVDDLD